MKILVLNGGGLDSLAVCKMLRELNPDDQIETLYIGHGLESVPRASNAARLISETYCDAHKEVHLYYKDDTGSMVPDDLAFQLKPNFVGVPFYCLTLLFTGYSYAVKGEFDHMVTGMKDGAYSSDVFSYLEGAIKCSKMTPQQPIIDAPIFTISTADLYDIIKDSPILTKTYSCNRSPECGICPKCTLRNDLGIIYDGGY